MDNINRDLAHFEGRLEKETYSKDEVAKLLHGEAQFTAQKTRGEFSDFVPRTEFEAINLQLESVKGELAPYKEAEFKTAVSSSFGELNGDADRLDDLFKLTDIKQGMTPEEIKTSIISTKESGKYNFLFTQTGSGAPKPPVMQENSAISRNIAPKMGLASKLFKK